MQAIKVINDPDKFKLLANDTRRKIVFLLRATEMNASQISETLHVTPQTIYHHLKKLQKADLIQVSREERAGHLIESFYRATAEAFLCSVGATSGGKEFLEKKMRTSLDSLIKVGVEIEYNDDDLKDLLEKQDEIFRCCNTSEFEEQMKDILTDIDDGTLSLIKEYGDLILMTDEEHEKQLSLKTGFRKALKSLLKWSGMNNRVFLRM